MSTGVYREDKGKLYVYAFMNLIEGIPFNTLENAIASKTDEGYFVITEIKNRKVNPLDFLIVKEGEIMENPFELSAVRMADLFGRTSREFEIIDTITVGKTNFDDFKEELRKIGFYRADKVNFKRAYLKDKFDRSHKAIN